MHAIATAGAVALLLAPTAPAPTQAECPTAPMTGYVIPQSTRRGPDLLVTGTAVVAPLAGWRGVVTPYRLTLQVRRATDARGGTWMPVRTVTPSPAMTTVRTPENTWRLVYEGTCHITHPVSPSFFR